MHWGLTAFERKRIERIALDHPYFDMHAQLLTKKELRTILAQGPRKPGPQVIAEVKNELGIAHAPETQEKRTLAEALHDASFVPSFRRMVVLSIFCLLLVLFMTLTVPGRAFAEEVYSIIVNYINGSLRARNSSPSSPHNDENFLSISGNIDSPQALSVELDYAIVISTDKLISFSYMPVETHSMRIKSKYQDNYGKTYYLQQIIYSENSNWGYASEYDGTPVQIQSSINITMFGGVSEDGTNKLVGFVSPCLIQLSSKQLSIAELTEIANKLQYLSSD